MTDMDSTPARPEPPTRRSRAREDREERKAPPRRSTLPLGESDRAGAPGRRGRASRAAHAALDAATPRESRAARRLRDAHTARGTRTRMTGPRRLLRAFTATELGIGSGLRISALTVLALSLLALLLWLAPGAAWTFGPVVALAGILLAFGWNALTGIDIPLPSAVMLALTGAIIPMVIAVTGDLGDGVGIFGLAVIGVVATSLASAPAPRDHSTPDSPQARRAAGESAPKRRAVARPRPTLMSLASALAALALIGAGSTWIALDALPQWSVVVPIAAIVAAAVVWGDQIGSSYRSQSAGALAAGLISGPLAGIGAYLLGKATALTPIVLPGLAHSTGPLLAVALLGVGAGLGVALFVIVLDGLLGDHTAPRPPLGALARGAAKFLVAALPIYAIIRIGGV